MAIRRLRGSKTNLNGSSASRPSRIGEFLSTPDRISVGTPRKVSEPILTVDGCTLLDITVPPPMSWTSPRLLVRPSPADAPLSARPKPDPVSNSAQRLQCWIERFNLAIGHVYRVTPRPESFRSVQDSIYGWWQVRGNHCSTVGRKKIVRLSERKRSNHRFAALNRRVAGNSSERRTPSSSPNELRRFGHSFAD